MEKVARVDMLYLRGIEVGCLRLTACKHGLRGSKLLRLLVAIVKRKAAKKCVYFDCQNSF